MKDKPGGFIGGWGGFKREEPNKIDKGNSKPNNISKQIGWSIGTTLSEVEEILKKQRDQKTRF